MLTRKEFEQKEKRFWELSSLLEKQIEKMNYINGKNIFYDFFNTKFKKEENIAKKYLDEIVLINKEVSDN